MSSCSQRQKCLLAWHFEFFENDYQKCHTHSKVKINMFLKMIWSYLISNIVRISEKKINKNSSKQSQRSWKWLFTHVFCENIIKKTFTFIKNNKKKLCILNVFSCCICLKKVVKSLKFNYFLKKMNAVKKNVKKKVYISLNNSFV